MIDTNRAASLLYSHQKSSFIRRKKITTNIIPAKINSTIVPHGTAPFYLTNVNNTQKFKITFGGNHPAFCTIFALLEPG